MTFNPEYMTVNPVPQEKPEEFFSVAKDHDSGFDKKKADKPKPAVYDSETDYLKEALPLYTEAPVKIKKYLGLLQKLGLKPEETEARRLSINKKEHARLGDPNLSQSLLLLKSAYGERLSLTQIFELGEHNEPTGNAQDLVFTDKTTGKIFNLQSLLGGKTININPDLVHKAFADSDGIKIPPPSNQTSSKNLIKTTLAQIYKKVEPLAILHEVGHTKQNFDRSNPQEVVAAERDAWRYALVAFRQLKNQGIDLLPDVSNEQMISRLELGLLSYDWKNTSLLPRRFSSRTDKKITAGKIEVQSQTAAFEDNSDFQPIKHLINVAGAILGTVNKDRTIITDALGFSKPKK